MKKFIAPLCLLIIFSCAKEKLFIETQETTLQKLSKITKTITYRSGIQYHEVIEYRYNEAGKLIAEGNKKYLRDEQQRIVQIINPNSSEFATKVFYTDGYGNKVAYTLCEIKSSNAKIMDSVVYVHDAYNRLVKMNGYVINEKAKPYLSHANILAYGTDSNLVKVDNYQVKNGVSGFVASYKFGNYDTYINPLYTEDEVRLLDINWDVINVSANNFTNGNNRFTKIYNYRKDGRPATCFVRNETGDIFTLTFEYR